MNDCLKKVNKNTGGFTLVEVTVALAVFAILVTVASGIIISGGNIFARNTNRVKASETANNVYSILNDRLSFATKIDLTKDDFSTDSGGYSECIKITKKGTDVDLSDERVLIMRENGSQFDGVCDTGAYDVTVTFDKIKKTKDENVKNKMTLLCLTINVYSNGETLYSKEVSIELLNHECEITGLDEKPSNEDKDLFINYTLAQ